jgi:hypothetical protein
MFINEPVPPTTRIIFLTCIGGALASRQATA